MEFDLENPFMTPEDFRNDTVPALFATESDQMSSRSVLLSSDSDDNLRFSVRRDAFSLISHAQYCYNVDPFISYLAVNYVDRFITRTKILEKKRWIVGILAISSLSLAAKMRNTDLSISISDLQRDEGFVFDFQSVHRMEVLILTTLDWRMRSITPFSFLNFFISLSKIEDSSMTQALKLQSLHIIFNSHHEMKLLDYQPSLIAASALLCATQQLIPKEFSSFRDGISSCGYINKERLVKCLSVLQEMVIDGHEWASHAVPRCTLTPTSVLDHYQHFTSEKNATISELRGDIKRRRLNDFSGDRQFQISQIQRC